MKSFFQITVLLVVPFFSFGQSMIRNDSLTLAKLHFAVEKYALQADSLTEEIIKFIDSTRDVSVDYHILAVMLLGNFNTNRVNRYLFNNFKLDFLTPGFLPDLPYLEVLHNNNQFTSYLFDYSHEIRLSKDQIIFLGLYLQSFMTKEQILVLAESTIKYHKDTITLANYQELINFISE